MGDGQDLRRGRHVVFGLHAHLVFVTKYRRGVLDADALARLRPTFRAVCDDFDAVLVEFNGERDHVHLLVEYPPKVAVSTLVNSLKGVSSRILRRDRADLARRRTLWSPSYFAASCGGAPISVLRRYIEAQRSPQHGGGASSPA